MEERNVKKIIAVFTIIGLLLGAIAINTSASGNSKIGVDINETGIEIGDMFTVTIWIDGDSDESIHGWESDILFNESTNAKVNFSSLDWTSAFWDDFTNDGSASNASGSLTGTWAINTGNPTTNNETALDLTFYALEVGTAWIKLQDAEVQNNLGQGYTTNVYNASFTIYPVEPAGLTATMTSDTAVSLSGFGSGNGGDYTVIRRATGSYPATPQSGTEVYNNTGSSTSDTSLSANTTYYYRAWTYNDTENIFSDDYQSDTAKTNAHPVNSNPSPANDADGQDLNPTISIDVYDYDDATQNMDVYFYTNESGSWVQVGSTNSSVNSGTYSQTPTNFDEWGTRYYWSVNTTDGINWDNDTYFFDTDPDDAATATNPYPADAATGVTLAPTCHVDISDDEGSSSIVVCFYTNESSTWSFKQKNTSVSDTDTVYWDFTDADTMNTKYWWRVTVDDGTNNETYGPWDFTTFNLAISNEYPNDLSTENSRPVANVSAYCAGSSMDVYIYFKNMTGTTDTWTLLDSWVDQSSDRFEVSAFDGNDLKWGNTTYTWSVNITIGPGVWVNDTYTFTTIELADGADARFDVNNDDEVKGTDLLVCYAYRDGNGDGYLYDGIYDVNNDGEIKGTDLLQIYART